MSELVAARESLWHCLHDARVRLQSWEPAERRLALRVSIPHLDRAGTGLVFRMEGVGRVECAPGSWRELAQALAEGELEVLEAESGRGAGWVELRLEGMLAGEVWHELSFHAETLEVMWGDGTASSLEVLLELGKAYWSARP